MYGVAESLATLENAKGHPSIILDSSVVHDPTEYQDVDVHVIHTHCADDVLYCGKPIVWVAHGTPEVMFHGGYEEGLVNGRYGHSDALMVAQFWLQRSDAIVTFWPRHKDIWDDLSDRRARPVFQIPMGVDKAFWAQPLLSAGRFAGSPSVFTAENCYEIKWPLDLFIAWPRVVRHAGLHGARLHAIYVPRDQHRWWFPLVNRNGASFTSFISHSIFDPATLRNAYRSTDFYVGLVRYGDFNRNTLEGRAAGANVISYEGNPYAHYWLSEGNQGRIADQLTAILLGEMPKREPLDPPDASEMSEAMMKVYESL